MNKKILIFISMLSFTHGAKAAMQFTAATSNYVTIGQQITQPVIGSSYTVSCWAKLTNLNITNNLVVFRPSISGLGIVFQLDVVGSNIARIIVRDNAGVINSSVINQSVSTNVWTNFIGTRNGNTTTLYVNGLSSSSVRSFGALTADYLTIGALVSLSTTPAQFCNGLIDDVRIYNRALSVAEINTIQNSRERVQITDGLIGYWPLDDASSNTNAIGLVLDRSGNGRNGTALSISGSSPPLWGASTALNYP